MAKVDPLAALARQQRLAAAVREAVDARLPELTGVDLGLPLARPCKTNPIPPAAGAGAAAGLNGRAPAPLDARGRAPERSPLHPPGTVDAGLPQLTPVDLRLPISPACGTNPNGAAPAPLGARGAAGLSPQQLAAARLVARGYRTADVAAELRVTRQALWKWRRHPAFALEVARLHELLARQPLASRRDGQRTR